MGLRICGSSDRAPQPMGLQIRALRRGEVAVMCVRVRRDYLSDQVAPASAGGFAAAAVLNALTPNDWRVSQDVELAVTEVVAAYLERAPQPTRLTVEVTVHSTRVDVTIDSDTADWVSDALRIRPRRPFESHISCELERPVAPPPRPTLWPALDLPRSNRSWTDVYTTLSGITQTVRLGTGTLNDTLQAIAAGVVAATDFTIAAVNIVRPSGDFEVVALVGDDDAENAMLHVVEPAENWAALIERSTQWGTLRFARGGSTLPSNTVMARWVPPDVTVPDPADPWNPEDELFAPLYSGNVCIGAISVDLPGGAPRPDIETLEKLELFAEHAAMAIERSRELHAMARPRE